MEFVRRLAVAVPVAKLPSVVERCVFGIEIDPTACARARDAVASAVAAFAGPQPSDYFESNIRCLDFLDLDPHEEPKFDLLIGNPPYVSASGLTPSEKERFLSRFGTAWGRLDLYALFMEQGLQLVTPGGTLAYITPDKWLTADSSRRLRSFVATNGSVRSISRFDQHDLFAGVATVPCVTVIDRVANVVADLRTPCRWWGIRSGERPEPQGDAQDVQISRSGQPWLTEVRDIRAGRTVRLGDLVERISAGIATGLNRCFILDSDEASGIEPELLRPVARGRDIRVGGLQESGKWMLVPYRFDSEGSSAELIDLADFPGARSHLDLYRPALERRHCVRVWGKAWYDVHDPITFDLARYPKILLPDLAYTPRFALDSGKALPLHSAYYLLVRADSPLTAEALTVKLNEPSVAQELRRRAPTAKSGYRRFRSQVLRDQPISLSPLGFSGEGSGASHAA